MRVLLCLVLVLLSLPLGAAPVRSGGPERALICGREYVRLSDWAERRRLSVKWTSKEECQVSGESTRIIFTINSQRISLNGVRVWLSGPVAGARGEAWVLPVDLARSIEPVLSPKRTAHGGRVRTICLDPGHGGRDTGNREGRREEKVYTLLLARELSTQLGKAGYKVVLTRTRDTALDLPDRSAKANSAKADLMLSLHFNAGPGASEARGTEVYCLTPPGTSSTNARGEGARTGAFIGNLCNHQNMVLAYHLQKALTQRLGAEDRGVKRARFAVLRTPQMPAVLIEGGFMSNPAEMNRIQNPAWRSQLAAAIVQGVQAYSRAVQ